MVLFFQETQVHSRAILNTFPVNKFKRTKIEPISNVIKNHNNIGQINNVTVT